VYDPDPPLAAAEMVVAWFTSTGLIVADGAVVSAGSTVRESVADAIPLTESVTVRVTVNGEPVDDVGVQLIDAEFEEEHPGGRLVHA
jgi:tetrahydrodipicolinate N-succinyltransferase